MKPRIQWLLLGCSSLMVAGLFVVFAPTVFANHWTNPSGVPIPPGTTMLGREVDHGYFTDFEKPLEGGRHIWENYPSIDSYGPGLESVTGADSFIAVFNSRLNIDLTGCDLNPVEQSPPCDYKKEYAAGAAMIINSMMGFDGTAFGSLPAGIANAQAIFPEWEAAVRFYDANGWVDWNIAEFLSGNVADWFGDDKGRGDVYWSPLPYDNLEQITVFRNPDGTSYKILRKCANPNGNFTALVRPPDFNLEPAVGGIAPTVNPGQTYTFTGQLSNAGDLPSTQAYLRIQNQTPGILSFVGQSGPNHPSGVGQGYDSGADCNSGAADSRSPCWWWRYSSIEANGTPSDEANISFDFRVSGSAPDGATACFRAFASPRSSTQPEAIGNQLCVTVASGPPPPPPDGSGAAEVIDLFFGNLLTPPPGFDEFSPRLRDQLERPPVL